MPAEADVVMRSVVGGVTLILGARGLGDRGFKTPRISVAKRGAISALKSIGNVPVLLEKESLARRNSHGRAIAGGEEGS